MSQENQQSFFSEPPLDGSLSSNSGVSAFMRSVTRNWNTICESGAFVFDIDETLMPPDDSLLKHEQLSHLLIRLMQSGVRLSLISGGPGTVIENRILKPLSAQGLSNEIFKNFTLYTNGGSTKLTYESSGWQEDKAYTCLHRIPGRVLATLRDELQSFINHKFELSHEDSESLFRIWRQKRHEQWQHCDVTFNDHWMRGEAWKLECWSDHDMAAVKARQKNGYTSYPFINTRGAHQDSNGNIEWVLGLSASGFYALSREKGDLIDFDIRDMIIEKMTHSDKADLAGIHMRKAGRSSIDITCKGADKAAALKDFVEASSCHPSLVFYFGDEFYEGGNDQPIAESKTLKKAGLCILALNKEKAPLHSHVLWIGRSHDATGQFLAALPI